MYPQTAVISCVAHYLPVASHGVLSALVMGTGWLLFTVPAHSRPVAVGVDPLIPVQGGALGSPAYPPWAGQVEEEGEKKEGEKERKKEIRKRQEIHRPWRHWKFMAMKICIKYIYKYVLNM